MSKTFSKMAHPCMVTELSQNPYLQGLDFRTSKKNNENEVHPLLQYTFYIYCTHGMVFTTYLVFLWASE